MTEEVRATVSDRLEFGVIRALLAALSPFPDSFVESLAAGLGRGAFALGARRADTLDNLTRAFSDKDREWVVRTARAAYSHLGREGVAMLRLAHLTPDRVRAQVPEAFDVVREVYSEGRGGVLFSGHFGNWELGAASVNQSGVPLDIIVQAQTNPLFDRMLNEAREALGSKIIDRRHAPRAIPRSLKAGRLVAFVADQDARGAGIFVPFFGRPASTHRGAGLFARRYQVPLVYADCLRMANGLHRMHLERVPVVETSNVDEDVHRAVASLTATLERRVRLTPEQYFWQHRRWKSVPNFDQRTA